MAGGFFRGVIHGGLLSAAALLGWALLAPLPEMPPQETGAAQPPDAASEPAPVSVPPQAQPAPEGRQGMPDASALDLPVGSEFGRGGDLTPRLPAAVSGSGDRPRAEVPAIAAPLSATESAPAATGAASRPETAPDPEAPQQPGTLPEAERPDLVLPQDAPARADAAAAAPVLSAPDLPGRDPRDAPPAPYQETPAPEDMPPPVSGAPASDLTPDAAGIVPVPRLHAPALDLSLPPDLSDLRRLERN